MKNHAILATFTVVLSLTGCSFSGYDASSKFACKAPEGVLCSSMSGIYANAMAHNLPDQRVHTGAGATTNIALGSYAADPSPASSADGGTNARPAIGAAGILPKALDSGAPVHTASREMRIWFAPWQDADADLHDQEYVYLIVDSGHWSIAHNQQRIQAAFRPVMPPTPTVATEAGANSGSLAGKAATNASDTDSTSASMSNADRVMQGILTPAGAVDRAAAAMPAATDH